MVFMMKNTILEVEMVFALMNSLLLNAIEMKIVMILVCLVTSRALCAQSPIAKGQFQLNAGIGLSSWGTPLYVGLDYGIHKDITFGGELCYRANHKYKIDGYHDHRIFGLSFNGNYHFNTLLKIPSNWDFYAGLNLGFYVSSPSNSDPESKSSGLALGAQIGGRYYFKEIYGINFEVGSGNGLSGGKFGVSYKF